MAEKITALYAWICIEPDGGEGLPAASRMIAGREMFLPMVGADLDRIESLRDEARDVSKRAGCPVKLVRFDFAAILEPPKRY